MREFRVYLKSEKKYMQLVSILFHIDGIKIDCKYKSKLGEWIYFKNVAKNEFVLEQFTGLKDKNGVEIYEGDIISVNGKYEKIVEFHADFFGFTLTNISDLKNKDWMEIRQRPHSQWFSDFKREIEVIGNIHQNKDLLK